MGSAGKMAAWVVNPVLTIQRHARLIQMPLSTPSVAGVPLTGATLYAPRVRLSPDGL